MTPVPARARADRSRTAARQAGSLRSVSPRVPRRVSGPLAGGAAVLPRPVAPPAAPQRLRLGPLRALPEHRVLDRLLRSRLWIWALGLLLGGIVAMQVSLLKLNSGISRAVETTTTLERQNAGLEAAIARLSSPDRIESGANTLGMLMPAAGDVRYLTPGSQDAVKAVRRMQPPSDAAAALLANGGIVPGSLADVAAASAGTATGSAPLAATETTSVAEPVTPLETTATPPTTTSTAPAAAVAGQG